MPANFKQHLERQLQFIRHSTESYDKGHEDEAIRIATSIRVLIHDTAKSTFLLTHMRAKSINLLSTSAIAPPTAFMFDGLTKFPGPKPKLGMGPHRHSTLPVDQWWTQTVYVSQRVRSARKDMVLGAANKDGGAHVDIALTPEYEIAMKLWIKVDDEGGVGEIVPVHLIGIRQMAYELLNSAELLALTE